MSWVKPSNYDCFKYFGELQCKCCIPLQTLVDVGKDFLIQDRGKLEGVGQHLV